MKQTIYVASYTTYPPAEGKTTLGLYQYLLDDASGSLELRWAVDGGTNPSFIALSADRKTLYLANESADGEVAAFSVDPDGGEPRLRNRQATGGSDPCYLCLDPSGRWLLAANYSSGSFAVFPIGQDGMLGEMADFVQHDGSGPNKDRQEKAHAHCIRFDPSGRFVLAVDLGMDRVFAYRLDAQSGRLRLNDRGSYRARPGAGPRHLGFHPNGRFIFIANELDSSVTACSWDLEQGALEEIHTLTTLPVGFSSGNTAADIHVTPDGKYLYVSNRGSDSIAAFRIDDDSGRLETLGHFPCGGKWPRNFAIDPSGRLLVVANQKSGSLSVFRIAADGSLEPVGQKGGVAAPVCVVFA